MLECVINKDTCVSLGESFSEGNQIKFIQYGYFYKVDQLGYEGLAEAIVSELERYIRNIEFIDYRVCRIIVGDKIYTGCLSKYNSNLVDITLYDLLRREYSQSFILDKMNNGIDSVRFVESFMYSRHNLNIHEYLGKLIKLDALVLNNDRHLKNIGFELSNGCLKPSRFYDFGGSLLLDIQKYPIYDSISRNLRKVKSKPFSRSFKKQVSYFSDVDPIEININEFLKEVEKVDTRNLDDCMVTYYNRSIRVLKESLNEKEGVVWKGISI